MRSLQAKFSALVVAILAVACTGLALVATRHERVALRAEIEKRGVALATYVAEVARGALLELEHGRTEEARSLGPLIDGLATGEGVRVVRVVRRDGSIVAESSPARPEVSGDPSQLRLSAPVVQGGRRLGDAHVELDLGVLVDPVVESTERRLLAAALVVTALGVAGGMAFVALLVGPLRRLRHGVESLATGNVSVRVPPTSRDEIGELTRAFNEMGDSLEQKRRLQQAFGRYVDTYVLEQLLEGPEADALAGNEREVTIVFADVRSFTRLSEGMEAKEVVSLLNDVFQIASDRIHEHGGTLDKFIGDSVMAYFGAPIPHADHAVRAVSAAVDLVRAIDERNRRAADRAGEGVASVPVSLGIGIHTGPVVVGNIGSDRRADYTAVGDAVNVAHRLEKLARPGEILVSEAVQRRVRTALRLRFEGERQLAGREEPVHVYSVEIPRKPPVAHAREAP